MKNGTVYAGKLTKAYAKLRQTVGSPPGLPDPDPPLRRLAVAILGVGVIKKRPVVIDDAIAIRPIMYLSLSFDHRLVDGAEAAKFLAHVVAELEKPR